ncbi:hypothetical protein A7K91_19105 [Paenibacillus oryzae]|uniref:Phage shock protein A n=1 Tax=Paenibacillus oryzae TaxID=1844972 RepID=A0A1A5YNZ7_9BACL|nr:PspA/IM30 family protein [Paenibacillus oryzae]OBR67329.1 hypothetical protein A7K91_19105 [Paenibacillus oryzae]
MSIFQRLFRIGKSNVNAALDHLEDPVKMIDQVLRELDEDIEKVTSAVTTQIAVEKRFERELNEANEVIAKRDAQARQALASGNESLAREALADKKRYSDKQVAAQASYDRAKATADKLRTQLQEMKARVQEMKTQKSTLVAQAEAAKAQERINKTMSGIGNNDLGATFNRMEERIRQMHDQADAAYELANEGKSLDSKFDELEKSGRDTELDDELAALKAELEGNKQ